MAISPVEGALGGSASWWRSLNARFLLIALFFSILPLVLLSMWLAHGTQRSGEALLRARLTDVLLRSAQDIGAHWVPRRSNVLAIADDPGIRASLHASPGSRMPALAIDGSLLDDLRTSTRLVGVRDATGTLLWFLAADSAGRGVLKPAGDSTADRAFLNQTIELGVPIREEGSQVPKGHLVAWFRADAILPTGPAISAGTGALMTLVDRSTGELLVPLPFDADLLDRSRFVWGGEEWIVLRRALAEPYVELIAVAPVTAFMSPFLSAARRGLLAVALVASMGFLLTIVLTRRVTRSLVLLAEGADAVAAGDLDRTVSIGSHDEVARLARAFNTMTQSLRTTLSELSQQQAISAVGEFAASLAHEIRNPLSAIRLNLQHLEEQAAMAGVARDPLQQSLRDIARLEATVAGALRVARTGRMEFSVVQLDSVIRPAIRLMEDQLQRRGVTLEVVGPTDIEVIGNAAALEQVFLNLLLNASQACDGGDHITVRVSVGQDAIAIAFEDTGRGMTSDEMAHAFDPFFSTKAEGSGLGLTVARRIITAHGGRMEIAARAPRGTAVVVTLPLARNASRHDA